MGAQIHVGPERVEVLVKNGPIHVLTLVPEEEYKLFPQPAPSPNLSRGFYQKSPRSGQKKNPEGLTQHGAPVLVQLKAGATQPESGNIQCLEKPEQESACTSTGSVKQGF